ncbi:DNA-binding transcriptional MerR regulator [Hydrogenophaga palleronii]|uniref:DNA-binding transcriptional MerR regulator n=1 Tax=Hydrogenophaga palleronii TaxID=65655 RepID=A0ABU1WNU4_9BURK|nr:MerR family DNA-binding protein [Hydrogenophaga palleronii]MDR7150964.1 DNA-binding transcriptional MerR regulator [Hydrogenophaga palleronii]
MKNSETAPEPSPELLTIGTLAKRVGLAVSALRYYEEVGLIPPALRRESGHRVYPESVQGVLILIRHCRDLGFSIEETRELVTLSTSSERDCVEARAIAQAHLTAVRAKMAELRRLDQCLSRYIRACSASCAGGPAPDCTILSDLRQGAPASTDSSGCCA